MATPKVGGEVDALCTRCKLTLAHTILAMVGTKIARVRCNTCGGDHAYRSPPGATDRAPSSASTRSASSTPRAASSRAAEARAERVVISFEQQLAGKDLANAPRYSPKEAYSVDQVIQHPTFGLGLVTAVRGDKMDVVFKSETKTLVQGRGGAPAERPTFQRPMARATGPADKPMSALSENEISENPAENPSSGD